MSKNLLQIIVFAGVMATGIRGSEAQQPNAGCTEGYPYRLSSPCHGTLNSCLKDAKEGPTCKAGEVICNAIMEDNQEFYCLCTLTK